jgi:ABC-type multidrug transport system fused ATPase/permease subunit
MLQKCSFQLPFKKEIKVLKNVNLQQILVKKLPLLPSGTGKSTIASLLLRFDIDSEILIDGKIFMIRENLRGNMSIVPQDVILFGGTIKKISLTENQMLQKGNF